ncbi:hypothetical protein FRX31_020236, partial [Thalictrum thalictroides]
RTLPSTSSSPIPHCFNKLNSNLPLFLVQITQRGKSWLVLPNHPFVGLGVGLVAALAQAVVAQMVLHKYRLHRQHRLVVETSCAAAGQVVPNSYGTSYGRGLLGVPQKKPNSIPVPNSKVHASSSSIS